MLADSVTYRALFSIFAGLLLGLSIAGLWFAGNPAAWDALIAAVDQAIPGLVGEGGVVDPDTAWVPTGFSLTGILSLVALVGASLGAIGALRGAFRVLSGTSAESTFFLWVIARNLLVALGVGVLFLLAAGLTIFARVLISALGITGPLSSWGVQLASLLAVFLLDVGLIAGTFWLLSGVKAPPRALWPGALLGGVGLLVLQELSSLFVRGAANNPLLATFGSLIALLLWVNLSVQVILYAACYICTGVEETHDRVHARFGATTFAERRIRQAEKAVTIATAELRAARDAAES